MKDNAKKILLTTLIVLLVTAAVTAAADKNLFSDIYAAVSKPLQKTAAEASDGSGTGKSREELQKENSQLHEEINDLVSRVIDYDDIKKENEILKKYYGIKDEHSDYSIAVASVIRRDPNDDFYGFTIDKGSSEDISVGDPVITDGGLAGYISEVGITTAKVTTLLSPEAKVGAMDQKTHDSGIATGRAAFSDDGEFILSVISADNTMTVGDIVITTGVGGVYPPNIVIGKVKKLDYNEYDTTPYAVITPYTDLRTISDVAVITSFEGQGVVGEAEENETPERAEKKNNE